MADLCGTETAVDGCAGVVLQSHKSARTTTGRVAIAVDEDRDFWAYLSGREGGEEGHESPYANLSGVSTNEVKQLDEPKYVLWITHLEDIYAHRRYRQSLGCCRIQIDARSLNTGRACCEYL